MYPGTVWGKITCFFNKLTSGYTLMFLFAGMIFEWLGSSSSFCRKTLILNGDGILFIYLFVQIRKLHCNLIYDHAIFELNSTWFCLLSCAWHSIVWNIFGSLYVLWCSLWSRVYLCKQCTLPIFFKCMYFALNLFHDMC